MEKVEILLNIMNLTVKFNEKDDTISEEITNLSNVTLDEDIQSALQSLESNLIKKIASDVELVSFTRTHFEGTSIIDAEFVLAMAEIDSMNGLDADVVIGLLNRDIGFLRPANEYIYTYALSNAAVSTGNVEAVRLAITKLHQLQGGN